MSRSTITGYCPKCGHHFSASCPHCEPRPGTQAFLAELATRRKWALDPRADIITIKLTKEHALQILDEWCDTNEGKP